MSVTKLVGIEYEKRNCPSANSFSRSVLGRGFKMYLSCRTTDVPVAATNDKNSLNLSEGISCPFLLNIKYSLIS